jgi:predicted small lipoprotein YifL
MRAKTLERVALAILCVVLAACGHYGPPKHTEPERGAPTATDANPDAEREGHD